MCKLPIVIYIFLVYTLNICVAQPKIGIQNEVDWGVVTPSGPLTEKQTVKARVPVKNLGDSVLIISNVRVQCGCTSAPIERDTLAPGEETSINITLSLPTGSGSLAKYVTVFSNDPSGAHVLRLKAEVQRPIQLASSFLAFDRGGVGQETKAVINVTVNADTSVTIVASTASVGLQVVTPMPLVLTKGKSADIVFRYIPIKPGPFQVEAVLSTTIPGYERIELSGYGAVQADPSKP
ncbi:MAG: DUF1573 domain-containing protein [Candidatus Kapabacteria bacterium]|nr:DUF1573 domain-containing protein [Candidatus Kapabacteria bacterium]